MNKPKTEDIACYSDEVFELKLCKDTLTTGTVLYNVCLRHVSELTDEESMSEIDFDEVSDATTFFGDLKNCLSKLSVVC